MNSKSAFWIHTIQASSNLSSIERVNEILFGLIMVLTFTCSISAATAGHEELSTILWSALGCNIAWGFVDSFMYLFSVMLERGETFANVRAVHSAATEAHAREVVNAMSPWSHIVKEEHLASLTKEIKNLGASRACLPHLDRPTQVRTDFPARFSFHFSCNSSLSLSYLRCEICNARVQRCCTGFSFYSGRVPGPATGHK